MVSYEFLFFSYFDKNLSVLDRLTISNQQLKSLSTAPTLACF